MKNFTLLISALILLTATTSCQTAIKADGTPNNSSTTAMTKPKFIRENDNSKQNLLNIPYHSLDTSKKVTAFGFGSCNDQTLEQPLWALINKKNFDLFLMMGDNVYASRKETKPIVDQYILLNQNVEYKKLRESTPFLATWDDHDYGVNDGGADNIEKDEARKTYLNYWSYLKHSLPKNQKAIYHSRIVGSKKERVQFIMLDTRWDRSPLVKNPDYKPDEPAQPVAQTATQPDAQTQPVVLTTLPKIYLPTTDTTTRVLGEDQWQWLDSELQKPAELRILVTSIQLIANDHFFEKWGNFPHERERFFKLLQKHKIKNLVLLSGDRHLSAISKYDMAKLGSLYEITSSGLNKASKATEPEVDSSYTAPSFLKINYGQANIDWAKKTVTFEIVDAEDKVQLSQAVKF